MLTDRFRYQQIFEGKIGDFFSKLGTASKLFSSFSHQVSGCDIVCTSNYWHECEGTESHSYEKLL